MKKRKVTTVFFLLLFLAGLSLLLYPTVSNWWNTMHQSRAITEYSQQTENINREEYEKMWREAQEYNAALRENPDRFLMTEEEKQQYEQLLQVSDTGMIGYVDIPAIDCSMPFYHGTDEAVLQVAAGHLEGTSLPVGGMGTHCAISGHRGLPSARLFTDLDKLKEGDLFTLRVLEESLTYEVDQILIVEPEDMEALAIDPMQDYCTLITCTPYGINSHRLLVRGHRVLLAEETEPEKTEEDHFPVLPVALAVPAAAVMAALLVKCRSRKKKKRRKEISDRK